MANHSMITGKRGEYMVIGKLLEKGLTVYTPVADIEGIDCIIQNDKKRLIKIQIKTRNKNEEESKQFIINNFEPDSDLFICCYLIDIDELWVIPSIVFYRMSYLDEIRGKRTLSMSLANQRDLSKYKDNLGLELLRLGDLPN
jgi:hypothetical protein